VVNLIASNSPVAPVGELITRFLLERGAEKIEGSTSEIFERLKAWNKDSHGDNRGLADYSGSVAHFGHQLCSLSELPGWKDYMKRSERRVGGRVRNQKEVVWSISIK
jgi:hypothetical protein